MSEKKKFTYEQGGSMRSDAGNDQGAASSSQPTPVSNQGMQYRPANQQTVQNAPAQPSARAGGAASKKTKSPSSSAAKKPAKKKKRTGLVAVLSILVILIVAVTVLQLTGVFNFVGMVAGLFGGSPTLYTYTVDSEEKLLRYLQHPALKAGDTLSVDGNFQVDVDEDFGSFAVLPLFNVGGSGSISFTGGTVVMSGAESSIDMGKVSFSDTELYIDAPNVSLTLGSADDTNINVASLNGAAHARQLDMPFAGTHMTVPVTLTNDSGGALSNVEVHLTSGGFIFAQDTVTVESIAAGGSAVIEVDAIAVEGGRHEILAYATNGSQRVASGTSGYINVLGPGYYAGDLHTHTSESRSQRYGVLEDNITFGYKHGMSFITSVENDKDAEQLPQSEIDALVGSGGAFLQLTGGETGDGTLHLLILGTDTRPSSDYGSEIMDHGLWIYQDAINEVVRSGGIVILPHFFSYGNLETMIPMLKSSRNATAMEIFTLDMKTNYTELAYYYNTWAAVNAQGRQKMFGLFTSNNVYSEEVGTKFIKGYMPTLTEQNIYDMLQTGNYLMSNGPDLRFNMSGVQMGGDIYVTEEGGTVNVSIYGSDTSPLQTVRLLKYRITGNIDDIDYEVAFEKDLTGQGVYSFNETFDLPIEPNTFYRVELTTESARNYEDSGLALSNPIYVYKGDTDSFCHIDKLSTAMGADVKQAPNGTYYMETSNLKTGSVNVTGTGENISVDYHINGGDYMADYVTVTMMGGDGSIAHYKIYVFNK